MTIETDASNKGWGAVVRDSALSAGGLFTESEKNLHINAKELLAAFLALKAFLGNRRNVHVKCLVDNMTAVSYIREMGGTHSQTCNSLARDIWLWASSRGIWLKIR